MTSQQVVDLPADRMEGDIVVAFFFQDQRPLHGAAGLLDWRLNGRLTELLIRNQVSGKPGETVVAANNGKLNAEWALFFGAGLLRQWQPNLVQSQLEQVLKTCRRAGFRRISLCFPDDAHLSRTELQNILNNILQGLGSDGPDCLVSCAEIKPALAV